MAVKIRLARRGRKKLAMYDIVVADARSPRDGKFIEKIGTYNPNVNPATILLNEDKAFKWVMNGAQPTDTTRSILSLKGVLLRKHLQVGVNKGAIAQEAADAKFAEWKATKDTKISGAADSLDASRAAEKAARLAKEIEFNAARAAAILKKNTVEEAPAQEESSEESAEVTELAE